MKALGKSIERTREMVTMRVTSTTWLATLAFMFVALQFGPTCLASGETVTDQSQAPSLPDEVKAKIDKAFENKLPDMTEEHMRRILELGERAVVVPYLVQILRDERADWLTRQWAASTLVMSKDPQGASATMQQIREYLVPGRELLTFAESEVLYSCISCLGRYGVDELENEAFKMLASDYWKDLPVPEERQRDMSFTVQNFRTAALNGLSHSGSERTVNAFETGNGIPEDLRYLHRGEMAEYIESCRKARETRLNSQTPVVETVHATDSKSK
ncbi:MAG: hypothetical protein WC655_25480 [Candidatus Hydrogenedentales bacterium]|jgi:hypothetical protein